MLVSLSLGMRNVTKRREQASRLPISEFRLACYHPSGQVTRQTRSSTAERPSMRPARS